MKNSLSYLFFLILLLTLTCCADAPVDTASASSCKKDEIKSSKLISTAEAYDLVANPKYIFVEVSERAEFDNGHIANALPLRRKHFTRKSKRSISGIRCSAEKLETILQHLGMKNDYTLILYDGKGGADAMRLAWVFDFYGFNNYKVLNGGKKAWLLAGYPLSTEQILPPVNPAFIYKAKENVSYLAIYDNVRKAISDDATIIIDTREKYEYEGQCFVHQGKVVPHKKGAYTRGCIPTAIHLNWSELSDLAHDHRIKCLKDLKYNLAEKGITKDKNIIVYCQSGSRSSHTAFVLRKILGFPNVKNYDGSWIEWSYYAQQDGGLPIEVHTSEEELDREFKRLESLIPK